MGLYEEADKSSAYLVRSVNNQYAGFSRLTPDYMNTTAAGVISKGPRCEGQAVWKAANGSYWLLGSHLTGWHANEAILARSDSPALEGATWTVVGNPSHSLTTYDSQSTYVLPVRTPRASCSFTWATGGMRFRERAGLGGRRELYLAADAAQQVRSHQGTRCRFSGASGMGLADGESPTTCCPTERARPAPDRPARRGHVRRVGAVVNRELS